MGTVISITKRELEQYFTTPLAYVFLVVFLILSNVFTFYIGNFFARGQADLLSFFMFQPWLFLFLIPALAMRLWSEELKTGTIELLLTMPVTTFSVVLGKFLATWLFIGLALLLTFPLWVTVNILGNTDNGVIAISYVASFLLAAPYLAISACMSSLTHNQVIAFILSILVCLVFMLSGFTAVTDIFSGWAPAWLIDMVQSFSFLTHFTGQMIKGVISLKNIVFILAITVFFMFANSIFIEQYKSK